MAELDQPKPPPVLDSFADLIDHLDTLVELTAPHGQHGLQPYHSAMDSLREIAAACGVDWEDVMTEHQHRVGWTD